jgi:rod shape-determining protein MreC
MRNLLNFLAKYNNLIIFLILEGIALYFISNGNNYHNTRIVKGIRGVTRGMEEKISNTRSYFHLKEINQELAQENAYLKSTLEKLNNKEDQLFFSVSDTVYKQQYTFSPAEVIDNSVNKQKNFFTIDKGEKDGLTVDMAVISTDGIAGVIVGCSRNFSMAMSVLNLDFRVSARIKSNGYFGSLGWNGRDYKYAILNEIPQHVPVSIGDTIETSGFSTLFPEGIMIGTVSDFKPSGGDFYIIEVLLNTDFRKLHYVNVIGNLSKAEQLELERSFQ